VQKTSINNNNIKITIVIQLNYRTTVRIMLQNKRKLNCVVTTPTYWTNTTSNNSASSTEVQQEEVVQKQT